MAVFKRKKRKSEFWLFSQTHLKPSLSWSGMKFQKRLCCFVNKSISNFRNLSSCRVWPMSERILVKMNLNSHSQNALSIDKICKSTQNPLDRKRQIESHAIGHSPWRKQKKRNKNINCRSLTRAIFLCKTVYERKWIVNECVSNRTK